MPKKYNEINKELLASKDWTKLVKTFVPGQYIFSLPDYAAVRSFQVVASRFSNDAEHPYKIEVAADLHNLGIHVTVTAK